LREGALVQHLRPMQGEVRGLQLPSLVRTRGRVRTFGAALFHPWAVIGVTVRGGALCFICAA
jgi:hypothetical protein